MFKFGKRSLEKLETCHKDLQKIAKLSINRSMIDFGISEGHRSVARQKELFNSVPPRTKIDGVKNKSKHNERPSMAFDIYAYHPDLETRRKIDFDKIHLSYLGGVIVSCAKELYLRGEITHKVRWGANWNSDGIIDYDQNFDDYPHFELIK